jgi:hypothetical protein
VEPLLKKLLAGDCNDANVFQLVDPTSFREIEFEAEVVKALTCLLPDYECGVFAGTFVLEGERRSADLALLHKGLSHWFVVEVELAGHSFQQHVLPQARCFRYGEPEQSCIASLRRAFGFLTPEQASSVLVHVPRFVAVIGNLPSPEWSLALQALDVQYLSVSVFRNGEGKTAHELEGKLIARTESLGFARYSAIENALRIHRRCGLPLGVIQVIDQFGNPSMWTVREASGVLWVTKNDGPALLEHDCYVQLVRTIEGRISLRPSHS